ncbi:MAG: acylphosphatase [Olsenella sp.]|jgi:acylphosphatase
MFGRKKEVPVLPEGTRRVHVRFVGEVQGVGFRWTCRNIAMDLKLTGWVKNEDDGSVTLELQGSDDAIGRFFTGLVGSFRRYHIVYHIDEKEDIDTDPYETEFTVKFY